MSPRIVTEPRLRLHLSEIARPERPLAARLFLRETWRAFAPMSTPGDRLSLAASKTRIATSSRSVIAGPNAPLLIRLARHPFSLSKVAPNKLTLMSTTPDVRARVLLQGPGRAFCALLDELHVLSGSVVPSLARERRPLRFGPGLSPEAARPAPFARLERNRSEP